MWREWLVCRGEVKITYTSWCNSSSVSAVGDALTTKAVITGRELVQMKASVCWYKTAHPVRTIADAKYRQRISGRAL